MIELALRDHCYSRRSETVNYPTWDSLQRLTDVRWTRLDNSLVPATTLPSMHFYNPPASVAALYLHDLPNDPPFLLLSSTESLQIIVLAEPFSGRSDKIETLGAGIRIRLINAFLTNVCAILMKKRELQNYRIDEYVKK